MLTTACSLSILIGLTLAGQDFPKPETNKDLLVVPRPADTIDVESAAPLPGAVVLFDGSGLDAWTSANGKAPAGWTLVGGGVMRVSGKEGIRTRETFGGPFWLHVEFRVPSMPDKTGQARGNSGVYVQGRYEVQVLDSYRLASQANDCGAIYEVAAPNANACKAPTVWQSYDIEFAAPRFEEGRKVRPAWMTVIQNGIPIHIHRVIPVDNTRAGLGGDPAQPGPIMLQSHGGGDPVEYRNIWLLPLDHADGGDRP